MDNNSWLLLRDSAPAYRLPSDLAADDALGARDCGWVEQMRPFIRHFCPPAGLVIDPFNGFGTTLVAASLEGRRGIGVELEAARAAIAEERLRRLDARKQTVLAGDLVDVAASLPQADLVLTNAPYFGCRWQTAREGDGQLYSASNYAGFLAMFYRVLKSLKPVLREGGHLIVMAENLRIGEHFVPMAWDLGRMMAEHFNLVDERILLYERPSAPLQSMEIGSNRSHEYALIARNERKQVDLEDSLHCLRELAVDFPDVVAYGSFARWLAGQQQERLPADVDLLVPERGELLCELARWFEARGFQVTRWGQPLGWAAAATALKGAHYFRAQRLRASGELCIFDVCFEDAVLHYDEALLAAVQVEGMNVLPSSRPTLQY